MESDKSMTTSNDNLLYGRGLTPSCLHILTKGKGICEKERRDFTYKDFPEVDYGTFRNDISRLRKLNLVEGYNSGIGLYWIIEVKKPNFCIANKTDRMGVRTDILDLILRIPLGDRCFHDIRFLLRVEGIYDIIKDSVFVKKVASYSGDIVLKEYDIGFNRVVKISVHANDSVSVYLGCSLNPFPFSVNGYTDLVSYLGEVRGYIKGLCDGRVKVPPIVHLWKCNGWHMGKDSVYEFSGDSFNITVTILGNTMRTYSKQFNDMKKLRIEVIEKPDPDLSTIFANRLNED